MKKATTAIKLDTRYIKQASDTFPVRLRITYNKVQKYYPTGINLTQKQWDKMTGHRPDELKETWLKLQAIESKAAGIIEKMSVFAFEEFARKFSHNSTQAGTLATAFSDYIKVLNNNDQVGTAISYTNAKNSLETFKKGMMLTEITPEVLQQYEKKMRSNGASYTTIGMYLRCVRSLFNKAIAVGDIPSSLYPFGSRKYVIKKGAGRKIALSLSDIKKIVDCKPEPGSTTEKARDLFYFGYLCNGINPKDLALLKFSNIETTTEGQFIRWIREKSARTKTDSKPITAHIKPQMLKIIKKWGNEWKADNYIFPVLDTGLSALDIKKKVNQFTGLLNDHLKIIAKECGIDKNLTTYVWRHSNATIMKRSGASTELISETLGHSSLQTTQSYLDSFEDETFIKATDALTDFSKIKESTSKLKAV